MTRTYEISIETQNGSSSFNTTRHLNTMAEAISWAKEFATDWYRNARYAIFCIETNEFVDGSAN